MGVFKRRRDQRRTEERHHRGDEERRYRDEAAHAVKQKLASLSTQNLEGILLGKAASFFVRDVRFYVTTKMAHDELLRRGVPVRPLRKPEEQVRPDGAAARPIDVDKQERPASAEIKQELATGLNYWPDLSLEHIAAGGDGLNTTIRTSQGDFMITPDVAQLELARRTLHKRRARPETSEEAKALRRRRLEELARLEAEGRPD